MLRLAVVAVLVGLPGMASAAPRWTFCVAAIGGGSEIWISGVFAAETAREALEGAFTAAVERLGGPTAAARCPTPRSDRTVALDALSDADAYDRQTGATVHSVTAADFPGKISGDERARAAVADARIGDRQSLTRSIAGSGAPDQTKR